MGSCFVCSPAAEVGDRMLVDHLQLFHSDVYGSGPERWPDGSVVVVDVTLEPSDFKERTDG